MENPEQDIHRVLEGLFLGSVAEQTATVAAYFLPDASYTSPCCHIPSFASLFIPWADPINSAWATLMIYRLCRIIFPRIEFRVNSCAFDQSACVLYLSLQQTISTWLLPVQPRTFHTLSVLQLRPLDKRTFEPDSSNPVRDASGCEECHALAGAGEKENEGVLYFIAGQRNYLQGGGSAGLLGAVKALGSVFCVFVAMMCMPVYCALWPEWVSERQSNREAQGRQRWLG